MRRFRTIVPALLLLLVAGVASADTWKIDPSHSVLEFRVRHLFSKVGGTFHDWSGTIEFDGEHITKGKVEVEIQAASIDTRNEKRDAHLRTPDFFDVEKYPTLRFVSTEIEPKGDHYALHGDLTLHGVTKPIVIDFEFLGAGQDPWGNTRAGFSGSTTINRKDFGMVWNKALDKGSVMLGDEVTIELEIEAVKTDAAGR